MTNRTRQKVVYQKTRDAGLEPSVKVDTFKLENAGKSKPEPKKKHALKQLTKSEELEEAREDVEEDAAEEEAKELPSPKKGETAQKKSTSSTQKQKGQESSSKSSKSSAKSSKS